MQTPIIKNYLFKKYISKFYVWRTAGTSGPSTTQLYYYYYYAPPPCPKVGTNFADNCGRSVGTVHSRTQATECVDSLIYYYYFIIIIIIIIIMAVQSFVVP
jgi:hypothetical protein